MPEQCQKTRKVHDDRIISEVKKHNNIEPSPRHSQRGGLTLQSTDAFMNGNTKDLKIRLCHKTLLCKLLETFWTDDTR